MRRKGPALPGMALLVICTLLVCYAGFSVLKSKRSVLLSYAPPFQDPYAPPDEDEESAMATLKNAKKDGTAAARIVRKIDHGKLSLDSQHMRVAHSWDEARLVHTLARVWLLQSCPNMHFSPSFTPTRTPHMPIVMNITHRRRLDSLWLPLRREPCHRGGSRSGHVDPDQHLRQCQSDSSIDSGAKKNII